MRVLLLTAGSRGDVEPFLVLARRARQEGHDVRLGVTSDFVELARGSGVEVTALEGNFTVLVERQGVSVTRALRAYRSVIRPMMAAILRSAARAAVAYRPDVIVYHPKVLSAPAAAQRLGVPHVLVEIVPTVTPTRAFPAAGVTTRNLGSLNLLTYRAAPAAERMFAGPLRQVRTELGLPALGPAPAPALTLVPVSPTLLPRPTDWPESTQITGAWHDSATTGAALNELDEKTELFLAASGYGYWRQAAAVE